TIEPLSRVGKHEIFVLLEQQSWATPPFASTHWPSGVVATHALPVQTASQVPAPQLSSCFAPHACGPARVVVAVVRGRVRLSVPTGGPDGRQSDETDRR